MGNDDDGLSFLMQVNEDVHDLEAALPVKVTGRLIAEKDLRVVDERTAIATRCCCPPERLVGPVGTHVMVDPDGRSISAALPGSIPFLVLQDERVLNVLVGREEGDQVEFLEDVPDRVTTQMGPLEVRHPGHVLTVDEELPGGGDIQDAQLVHHCRFSRTGRPHDRHEIIVPDFERDVVEGGKVTALQMVYLRHVHELDQGRVSMELLRHCFLNFAMIHFLFIQRTMATMMMRPPAMRG